MAFRFPGFGPNTNVLPPGPRAFPLDGSGRPLQFGIFLGSVWNILADLPVGTENIVSGSFTVPDADWVGVQPPVGSLSFLWLINGVPHPSGIHTGPPMSFTFDTTAYPDGTYCIYPVFVDSTAADPATTNLPAYYVQAVPLLVIINNTGAGVTDTARMVPVSANFNARIYPNGCQLPDFVQWPGGTAQPQNTVHSYPSPYAPPSNSPALLNGANLYCEGPFHLRSTLYETLPRFWTTTQGGVIARHWSQGDRLVAAQIYPWIIWQQQAMDGGGRNNFISAYSTFVDTPDMSGMTFIDLAYGIRKFTWGGTVTTIFGVQNNRDVLPLDYTGQEFTTAYSQSDINAHNNFVGSVTGNSGPADSAPFVFAFVAGPLDLGYVPADLTKLRYATSINGHMIAELDVTTATARIYAGYHGVAGYVDGPAIGGTIGAGPSQNARFDQPRSLIVAPDGTTYVADYNNRAIRKISADGTTVTTLVGGTIGPSCPDLATVAANRDLYSPTGTVSFASAYIPFPDSIRFDETGNIIVADTATYCVRRIDLTAQTVTRVGVAFNAGGSTEDNFLFAEVITAGNIGPTGTIIISSASGATNNQENWMLSPDGSTSQPWPNTPEQSLFPEGRGSLAALGFSGHYPWGFFPSKGNVGYPFAGSTAPQARAVGVGTGSMGISSIRALLSSDPPYEYGGVGCDLFSYGHGQDIWISGTCVCFPWGSRPGLASLIGLRGHHMLGSSVVMNIDDMVAAFPDDASLGAYIQSGCGGSVPRPEITGNDLIILIYYIRRTSRVGSYPTTIGNTTPLAPGTPPVISGVSATRLGASSIQVSWATSTPTIGMAASGTPQMQVSPAKYASYSPIESGFGLSHSVVIEHMPAGLAHFCVIAKDWAGNAVRSPDAVIA